MTRAANGRSRITHSVQALLVCAVLLMVGVAAFDDYGASWDAGVQMYIADRAFDFMLGKAESLAEGNERFYGVAFELPLLWVDRILGLGDGRHIMLSRHLLTHTFFLAAALCCSLLTYRMFNSRPLALLALLLFVLHPRLYAQSFYNSKDLPFLSMFMISLYLTHRAFSKDSLGAFLICGLAVGILTNLRIMGIMLFPAVLAMRALDLLHTPSGERKRVMITLGVFTMAGGCALYAVSPHLWANPLELLRVLETFSNYPVTPVEMFQGVRIRTDGLPPHFIPTWIAISTPPATLLLTAIGVVLTCARSLAKPSNVLNNGDLRFGVLLLACLMLPLAAIVLANSSVYDAWRHLSFLYAPMCLLALKGLHWIGASLSPSLRIRTASYALLCMGMAVTAAEMVRIHPHQQAYFNLLVDRATPEHLRSQYEMDPRHDICREGLAHLLRRHPRGGAVRIADGYAVNKAWVTFPKEERERLLLVREDEDYRIICGKMLHEQADASKEVVFSKKLYNSTILRVQATAVEPNP